MVAGRVTRAANAGAAALTRRRQEEFIAETVAYVTALVNADPSGGLGASEVKEKRRNEKARTLERVGDTVYSAVLLSASALRRNDGAVDEAVLTLARGLTDRGVFVLLLGESPAAVGLGSHPKLLQVAGAAGVTATSAEVATELFGVVESNGLNTARLLVLARQTRTESPPATEYQVVEDLANLARTQDGSPLAAFATDEDEKNIVHSRGKVLWFPVVAGGQVLFGPSAAKRLMETLLFERRINMSEASRTVQDGSVLNVFEEVSKKASQNRVAALGSLDVDYPHVNHATLWDHRSGAVCFRPLEWTRLLRDRSLPALSQLQDYFTERLPGDPQTDRPSFRRILYTPSRVLGRGEQYYVNMKNIARLERVRAFADELKRLCGLSKPLAEVCRDVGIGGDAWKLTLAGLDQLRNVALQLFFFVHSLREAAYANRTSDTPTVAAGAEKLHSVCTSATGSVNTIVRTAIRCYYAHLLGQREAACEALQRAIGLAESEVLSALAKMLELSESWVPEVERISGADLPPLVRRWREADHPGENLLVAVQAAKSCQNAGSVDVVGIGWGAVELPLVFDYIAELEAIPAAAANSISMFVPVYSHYRRGGGHVLWFQISGEHRPDITFVAERSVLFDDNTLTGLTLETVRDMMLIRGADSPKMFVVRYSGERRFAQMRMPNHGVIDPEILLESVEGYVAETAFARSWSPKAGAYETPVGVFSLARRRVLECIHNNSICETWDREGF